MVPKMTISLDQYYVLFGKVREIIIMSNPDRNNRERLIYHWNTRPTREKKKLVDEMLENGSLACPPKYERR